VGELIEIDDFQVWRSMPDGTPRGGLIVNHEIWGLVDHARDVADRFAAQGYVVYAPDLLSNAGTTPEIGEELQAIMGDTSDEGEERRSAAQPRLRAAFAPVQSPEFGTATTERLVKVVDALEREPGVDGRIGVVGFCFGGSFAFAIAAADSRIKAAVPFYGSAPSPDQMRQIRCPVLAIYGADDEHLIDALPTVRQQMADAGVDVTFKVYENAGHAFFNDQNTRQHEAGAAADAWQLTLDFFAQHLN
jgi:carboxymethylenebutenolidase